MMDKENIINSLSAINQIIIETEDYDKALNYLEALKIHSLINYELNVVEEYDEQDKTIVPLIIRILQYIDNNSGVISPVSNENYDALYELNKTINDEEIVGSVFNANNKAIGYHTYPDLRGTLEKVHFLTVVDKGKDKRRSLEEWRKSAENKLGRPLRESEKRVVLFPKWDGLSGIFECDPLGIAEKVLSRGDTDKNEALDWTVMFKGADMNYVFGEDLRPKGERFGVKTEIIMDDNNFEALCKKYGEFKSKRSAVSSILNSELDPKYRQYLTAIPLQYQMLESGHIDIPPVTYSMFPYVHAIVDDVDSMQEGIDKLKDIIKEKYGFDIDGIVIRLLDQNIQKALGRDGKINKYEVAYKFPPEQKKTELIDVQFQIGLMGTMSPVAKIKPVKIKGNTIKSISLGSMDRFESIRHKLRKGAEVIIKYDIIPYLTVDDTCITGDGQEYFSPVFCPYCEKTLVKDPVLRCVNLNCDSRIIGKIMNYTDKMRIANISIGTITTLFNAGYLKSIEDLYRLEDHKRNIAMMEGFGEVSVNNIIAGINARLQVYDYELLGSLGIPNIGRKMFKRISNIYYLDELIDICNNNDSKKLLKIGGIKDKTCKKIIEGVQLNKKTIQFLRSKLDVRRDEKKYTIKVCFTKVRDKDFEAYLESKNVLVMEDYSKEVDMVIIKDSSTTSGKIDKAKKQGKEIVTLDEAKKMFGYEE